MNKIENLTPKRLSDVYGASERWWQRKLPELRDQGVVSKRGRLFFGRLDDIAAWLHNPAKQPRQAE
jgi:hypothetical protein